MPLYTIAREAEVTLEIKKSKFIGRVRPVTDEEEAKAWIAEIQKRHHDATHNCYAYLIGTQLEIQKSNDDGEPAGTAGRPILETLKKNELHNVAAVVTRYFGGILLGASGLIRAYSQATAAAVRAAGIVREVPHASFLLEMDYEWWGRLQHWLHQAGHPFEPPSFSERVSVTVYVPEEATQDFLKKVSEMTNGSVAPKPGPAVVLPLPVEPTADDS